MRWSNLLLYYVIIIIILLYVDDVDDEALMMMWSTELHCHIGQKNQLEYWSHIMCNTGCTVQHSLVTTHMTLTDRTVGREECTVAPP